MQRQVSLISGHSYKFQYSCHNPDNALFHVYSGPLFANVEGYVYLDLIIWGLSPLLFLFLRPRIVEFMQNNRNLTKSLNLKLMIIFLIMVIFSYLFMNYSHTFNWNYFSRSFNLDFGYFIFDFLMRAYSLLVQLEEDQEGEMECDGYCQLKHSALTFVYIVVFYLSSSYDLNERDNGPKIFAIACVFSFVFTLSLPIVYYFKNKHKIHSLSYQTIRQQEEVAFEQATGIQFQPLEEQKGWDISVLAFTLANSSLLINVNYFSLWMMQPIGQDSESSYQQYNVTIEMVSGFFMLSSFSYFISFRIYSYGYVFGKRISKFILSIYGLLILFVYWTYEVNYICMVLLGFGFQQISVLYFGLKLERQNKINHKFFLYNQVLVYFILPLILTPLQIGTTSLKSYAFLSGFCLFIGALLM